MGLMRLFSIGITTMTDPISRGRWIEDSSRPPTTTGSSSRSCGRTTTGMIFRATTRLIPASSCIRAQSMKRPGRRSPTGWWKRISRTRVIGRSRGNRIFRFMTCRSFWTALVRSSRPGSGSTAFGKRWWRRAIRDCTSMPSCGASRTCRAAGRRPTGHGSAAISRSIASPDTRGSTTGR